MKPPPLSVAELQPVAALLPGSGAWLARAPIAVLDEEELPGWSSLGPEEQRHALSTKPRRLREFVAGRVALRAALFQVGWEGRGALLSGEQGRPSLPPGFVGSITHKDGLAFAVAAPRSVGWTLGVDSEVLGDRERCSIAPKILRPAELARWRGGGGRWPKLLEIFSMKEAIYKALHPQLPRYIGFDEAEIDPQGGITMQLRDGAGPFVLEGALRWEGQRLITLARARLRTT